MLHRNVNLLRELWEFCTARAYIWVCLCVWVARNLAWNPWKSMAIVLLWNTTNRRRLKDYEFQFILTTGTTLWHVVYMQWKWCIYAVLKCGRWSGPENMKKRNWINLKILILLIISLLLFISFHLNVVGMLVMWCLSLRLTSNFTVHFAFNVVVCSVYE